MRQIQTLIQQSLLLITIKYGAIKSDDIKVIIAEADPVRSGSFERPLARDSAVQSKLFYILLK